MNATLIASTLLKTAPAAVVEMCIRDSPEVAGGADGDAVLAE